MANTRWATRRATGKEAKSKRESILNRIQHPLDAKKRNSAGSDDEDLKMEEPQRRVWFNLPLPHDAVDELGFPREKFVRNKIRTAKYTPMSFVPKNLYFQFQNAANPYFLFIIILNVSWHRSW